METENAIPSTEQSDWNSFQIFLSHFTHDFNPFRDGSTSRGILFAAVGSPDTAFPLQHRHQSVAEVQGLRTVLDARTPLHSPNAYTTSPTTAWKSLKSVRFKSVFSHHSYTLGTTKLLNRFASQPTHKTFLAERMEGNSSHELIWIWYLFQFFTIKFPATRDLPDVLFVVFWGWAFVVQFFLWKLSIILLCHLSSALHHNGAWSFKLALVNIHFVIIRRVDEEILEWLRV